MGIILQIFQILVILSTISAYDSKIQFGVISHNSAEIFVTPTCREGIVEYRNVETGETTQLRITKPPYATKITGLEPAAEYQIRTLPAKHEGYLSRRERFNWRGSNTFRTDLYSVFGRATMEKNFHESNYDRPNSRAWNATRILIQESYKKLALPYQDMKILRILRDRLGKPVVHYRFKLQELSGLTRYELSEPDFADSMIQSGGTPVGTPYAAKEGNKVTLFYRSNRECFSLIERYMVVSRDDGTREEFHLNVADSTATSPAEEDGLEVTSKGALLRDDGIPVGRLKPDTLAILTPRFLILDCQENSTEPIYSELYSSIDYVTKQPEDIIYKYIEPENISSDPVELRIKREPNRTMLYISPTRNVIKYEILSANKVVSTVEGKDVKCRHYTKAIISGFANNKSYTIVLRAIVQNKIGKQASVILRQGVTIRAEECALPPISSNLRLTYSSMKRMVYFQCSHGTQLRGKSYAFCGRNGRWTDFPICEEIAKPCRVLFVRNSVTPTKNRFIYAKGETVRYTCRDGYILDGSPILTCAGIHWNEKKPSCRRVTCPAPKRSEHLMLWGRRKMYHVGSGIVFNCDEGYQLHGSSTSNCLTNGTWSSKTPKCTRIKMFCKIPFRLQQFSEISPMKKFYNESEVVQYRCNPGYTPFTTKTSMCLPNGHWSTKLPQCKKFAATCTASRLQRRWIRPERYFPVGYRVVFGCPRGYRIYYGSYTTYCLPNGRWSFSKPRCYADQTLFNPSHRPYTRRRTWR